MRFDGSRCYAVVKRSPKLSLIRSSGFLFYLILFFAYW